MSPTACPEPAEQSPSVVGMCRRLYGLCRASSKKNYGFREDTRFRIHMAQIRSRDLWELTGPRTLMSDLEQPAHECADTIETSDEDDTTVEEPDAEIDN